MAFGKKGMPQIAGASPFSAGTGGLQQRGGAEDIQLDVDDKTLAAVLGDKKVPPAHTRSPQMTNLITALIVRAVIIFAVIVFMVSELLNRGHINHWVGLGVLAMATDYGRVLHKALQLRAG